MNSLLPLLALSVSAHAFSFTLSSSPAQCSNLTINWSGGSPPYEITLLPFQSSASGQPFPESLSVLDANTSSTSWSTQLPFPASAQFVIVLSDATGFGTGGTSDVYVVANSSSTSCIPSSTSSTNFTFFTDPNIPIQCENLQFYGFNIAGSSKPPVVVSAVIPGGNSFQFPPNMEGAHAEGYIMDVMAGTLIAFIVGDSTGRATGGSSANLMEVQGGGGTSCLSSSSPASTTGPAAGVITGTASATAASSSTGQSVDHTGVIVGGVVGGIVGLALVAGLIFSLVRGRHARPAAEEHVTESSGGHVESGGNNMRLHEIRAFPTNDSDSMIDGKGKQSIASFDD